MPGMSAPFRLAAFLFLFSYLIVIFWGYTFCSSKPPYGRWFSPFLLPVFAGILFLYFVIPDDWTRYAVWPGIVAGGGLFLGILSIRKVNRIAGLLTTVVLWSLVGIHLVDFPLFVQGDLQNQIERFFPVSRETFEAGGILLPAILIPDHAADDTLAKMAVIFLTSLLVAFFYGFTNRFFRFLSGSILFFWFVFLLVYIGNYAFYVVGFPLLIFTFFSTLHTGIMSWKKVLLFIGIALLCVLGTTDILLPISFWLNVAIENTGLLIKSWDMGAWIGGGILEPFQIGMNENPRMYLCCLVIAAGVILLFYERWSTGKSNPVLISMGFSILFFCIFMNYSSVLAVMGNPLSWVAIGFVIGGLCDEYEEEANENPQELNSKWITAFKGGLVCLCGVTLYHFYVEMAAESALKRYSAERTQTARIACLEEGLQMAPYRPDLSSLYAVTVLQTLSFPSLLPSNSQLSRLDQALLVSAKKHYIPLLAYKRLFDLYFVHSKPERSIQVLSAAVQFFPEQVLLHEWLGDRLETIGRREEAIHHYQICVNLNPVTIRYREKLAKAYQLAGRMDEYELEIERLRILNPVYQ